MTLLIMSSGHGTIVLQGGFGLRRHSDQGSERDTWMYEKEKEEEKEKKEKKEKNKVPHGGWFNRYTTCLRVGVLAVVLVVLRMLISVFGRMAAFGQPVRMQARDSQI